MATSLKNSVPSCCVIILQKICIRLRPILSKIGRALFEWMVDLGVDNKSLFPLFAIIAAFITPPMRYTNLKQCIFICLCMHLLCYYCTWNIIYRGYLRDIKIFVLDEHVTFYNSTYYLFDPLYFLRWFVCLVYTPCAL